MAEMEEKINIIEKTHISQQILDSLRHKAMLGERRSDFIEGMNHTYEEEEDISMRRSTRRSTILPDHLIEKDVTKCRFKATVHLLTLILFWMHTSEKKTADDKNFAAMVRLIRRKKGPMSILTYHEKIILTKHPFVRTENDIQTLAEAFSRIRHFKTLGMDALQQMAKTAEFSCFGPNRKVMRQNSPATGMYLIISGEVSGLSRHMDPIKLCYHYEPFGTIGPGEILGEVSLIYDIPRVCTIVTMATCEMVFWEKNTFKEILLEPFLAESNHLMLALKKSPYFEDFTKNALRDFSCKSYIEKYPKDSLIKAHGFGEKYYVHIMLKGECHLIHRLNMVHGMNKKGKRIFPYIHNGQDLPQGHIVVTHFFIIASYSRGMVFNLGEPWRNRMVLAHTDVEILFVPIDLLEKYGLNKAMWNDVRLVLKDHLPDEKKIYDEYYEKIKTKKKKDKMLKYIYDRKRA